MSLTSNEYRQPWESDEHWNLRKEFLDRYRDEFDEDRLLCLAQVYTNMELLNCSYPEEVEQKVRELAVNLTLCKELKNTDKDVIHFVKPEEDGNQSYPPNKKLKFQRQMFVRSSETTQENELMSLSTTPSKSPEVKIEQRDVQVPDVKTPDSNLQCKNEARTTISNMMNETKNFAVDQKLLADFQNMSNYIKNCFSSTENYKKCLNLATGRMGLAPIQYQFKTVPSQNSKTDLNSCTLIIRGVIASEAVTKSKDRAQAEAIEQTYRLFMNEFVCISTSDSGALYLKPSNVQVADKNILSAVYESKKNRMKPNKEIKKQIKQAAKRKFDIAKPEPIEQSSKLSSPLSVDLELPENTKILHLVEDLCQLFPVPYLSPDCPAFVLFDNTETTRAEHAYCMLTQSASFSRIPLNMELQLFSNDSNSYYCCTIQVNNNLACQATGKVKQDAKRAACDALLDFFRKKCYTIKAKNFFHREGGFKVTRDLLMSNNNPVINDSSLSNRNVGHRMLQMMGWSGGGIGSNQSGILEPIIADTSHGRKEGLGFSHQSVGLLSKVESFLQQYISSNMTTDLIFDAEYTKEERKKIHHKADNMGLKSSSRGPDHHRQIIIGRKYTMKHLFQMLIQNMPNEKYHLISPEDKSMWL